MTPPPVFQLGIDFEKGCQWYVCSTWSRLFAENWNLSQPPPLTTNYNVSVLIGTYGDPSKQEYPKNWKIDSPPPLDQNWERFNFGVVALIPAPFDVFHFFCWHFLYDDHLLTSCLSVLLLTSRIFFSADLLYFVETSETNNILLIGTPLTKNILLSVTLPAINNLFVGTYLEIYSLPARTHPTLSVKCLNRSNVWIGQMSEKTCVFRHMFFQTFDW